MISRLGMVTVLTVPFQDQALIRHGGSVDLDGHRGFEQVCYSLPPPEQLGHEPVNPDRELLTVATQPHRLAAVGPRDDLARFFADDDDDVVRSTILRYSPRTRSSELMLYQPSQPGIGRHSSTVIVHRSYRTVLRPLRVLRCLRWTQQTQQSQHSCTRLPGCLVDAS